ncbi:TetR family transcriptional regulator [Undibacterium luofuense]|jgi:TetR/AcrR family acrAB operon transcriptional repressor|uniref:TetR family transcriptional regulator n=1 Tax=Undibacterium luofuense TaxID=2828733 RepID=A0A941I769_9BURK|nr:TetR family transcriptional regulator [Undibacterium luofuense]MBR7781538.1 TetR family transcriptional regulator [Undibacterium luofuense]
MVRKTKEEAQETHTALLNAAEQVFATKGVTNTTLNDVAQAAGMTRGAIYWHFKDKNALFKSMCDRAFLPMEALLNEVTASRDDDPLAALRRLNLHFLQLTAGDERQRRVFDIMFHHCEKNSVMQVIEDEKAKRDECLNQVESLFVRAVELGMLPPDTDTYMAMQANHAYLVGIVHEWLEDTQAFCLLQKAEAMVDLFIAGLRACPPRISAGCTAQTIPASPAA